MLKSGVITCQERRNGANRADCLEVSEPTGEVQSGSKD